MCIKPKKLYLNGYYKEDNYNGKKGEKYNIECFSKCGHCSQCIAEKANNWVIRNYYESQDHKDKCFITLTYANNPKFLILKDLQDFIKNLRRQLEYHNKIKIRTFNVGEYGTLHYRPHFHLIIYGWKDKQPIYKGLSKKHFPVFESSLIHKIWGKGITAYQEFNEHEIPYIALYDTAREEQTRQYIMKRTQADKLIKQLYKEIGLDKIHEHFKNIAKGKGKNTRTTDKKREETAKFFDEIRNNYKELMEHINFKTKDKKKRYRAKINYDNFKSIVNQIEQLTELIEESKKEKSKYIKIREFNTWSQGLGFNKFFEMYKQYKEYDFHEFIEDKEFLTPTSWVKKLANYGFEDARKEMLRRSSELATIETEEELANKNRLRKNERKVQDIIKWADIENQPFF